MNMTKKLMKTQVELRWEWSRVGKEMEMSRAVRAGRGGCRPSAEEITTYDSA